MVIYGIYFRLFGILFYCLVRFRDVPWSLQKKHTYFILLCKTTQLSRGATESEQIHEVGQQQGDQIGRFITLDRFLNSY
jgi:hypothetical protein